MPGTEASWHGAACAQAGNLLCHAYILSARYVAQAPTQNGPFSFYSSTSMIQQHVMQYIPAFLSHMAQRAHLGGFKGPSNHIFW